MAATEEPGAIPARGRNDRNAASGVILTVECGYLQTPKTANAVELRIMPFGYGLDRVLDIHKHSALGGGGIPSIDAVVAVFHTAMASIILFIFAIRSTTSTLARSAAIVPVLLVGVLFIVVVLIS